MKRLSKLLLIFILLTAIVGTTLAQTEPLFTVQATSAILMDAETGQVLFEQNADERLLPASLVKIMTLYLTFDTIKRGTVSLQDRFPVSINAWQPEGSKMFIREGEFVSVDDLIKGVAVVSGNDACIALAEGIAGVTEVFVQSMNQKAQALGLENTNFTDVHGLDNTGNQYTTAKDVATLAKSYVTDHPVALDYHSTLEYTYNGITQKNRNGLLWTYPGVDGLKTGHLSAVGYNLVATAHESDMRLIAVVLGASSESIRETEVRKLLNYGFRNFESVKASELVEPVSTTVYKGKKGKVDVIPATDSSMVVPLGARDQIRVVRDLDSSITAPVKKGESVGEFRFYWQDELIASIEATVAEDVEKGGFFKVLWDSIRLFFANLFSKVTNK